MLGERINLVYRVATEKDLMSHDNEDGQSCLGFIIQLMVIYDICCASIRFKFHLSFGLEYWTEMCLDMDKLDELYNSILSFAT